MNYGYYQPDDYGYEPNKFAQIMDFVFSQKFLYLCMIVLAVIGLLSALWHFTRPRCLDCQRHTNDAQAQDNGEVLVLCADCQDIRYDEQQLAQLKLRMKAEPKRDCPACETTMVKELTVNRLIIDVCPACQSVFLSGRELAEIIQQSRDEGYEEGESDGSSTGFSSGLMIGIIAG